MSIVNDSFDEKVTDFNTVVFDLLKELSEITNSPIPELEDASLLNVIDIRFSLVSIGHGILKMQSSIEDLEIGKEILTSQCNEFRQQVTKLEQCARKPLSMNHN